MHRNWYMFLECLGTLYASCDSSKVPSVSRFLSHQYSLSLDTQTRIPQMHKLKPQLAKRGKRINTQIQGPIV